MKRWFSKFFLERLIDFVRDFFIFLKGINQKLFLFFCLLRGGGIYNGSGAGPFYFNITSTLSYADVTIGFRLSPYAILL